MCGLSMLMWCFCQWWCITGIPALLYFPITVGDMLQDFIYKWLFSLFTNGLHLHVLHGQAVLVLSTWWPHFTHVVLRLDYISESVHFNFCILWCLVAVYFYWVNTYKARKPENISQWLNVVWTYSIQPIWCG